MAVVWDGGYPLPPREKRRSVPDGARDGATTHQMRHHGRRAGGAGGKACNPTFPISTLQGLP